MNSIVPVLVTAYNRPDYLLSLLDCLKADKIPLLYIYSDGPKSPEQNEPVIEVRNICKQIDWCEVNLIERDVNLGLGPSVRAAVTEVLTQHESVIVFEDDLICVPGTYNYLVAALSEYRKYENVMSVTAWTHPNIIPEDIVEQPYFDGKGECWAWATWKESWIGMDTHPIDMMLKCIAKGIDIKKYGSDLPKLAHQTIEKNTWAIGWWYLHFLKGGLCMRPPYSMAEHIGWDSRGTTALEEMKVWSNPPLKPSPKIPDIWPEPIEHPECLILWKKSIGDTI